MLPERRLGGAWFYDALVKSDIVVTHMRGSYNEHLAGQAIAFLLAFTRLFDHYLPQKGMLDISTRRKNLTVNLSTVTQA